MTAFKKLSVFAVLVAIALIPSVASANVITCAVTATSPQIRAEGIAELVGDITLTCTSGEADIELITTANFLVNIVAYYNTNVTNPENADDEVTNAVLVVGGGDTDADGDADVATFSENECVTPADAGAGTACDDSTANVQDPQYAERNGSDGTSLKWEGVVFPVPNYDSDADDTAEFNETTTLRLTGVRVNASLLGLPSGTGVLGSDIEADITMLAFPTGDNSVVLSGEDDVDVGTSLLGLGQTSDDDIVTDGLQCADETAANSLTYITIEEGFPTAFRDAQAAASEQDTISNQVTGESGHAEDNSAGVGGASQATQIMLSFTGVPDGVEVGVLLTPDCQEDDPIAADGADDADTLVLTAWTCDADGVADAAAVVVDDADSVLDAAYADVALTDGAGQICYDVSTNSSALTEDCAITIVSGWTADTANDAPARASYSVSTSYAPLSAVTSGDDDTALVPRFLTGTGHDAWEFGTVNSCASTILFPYVTNQSGFDTGLVVANTSMDGDGDGIDQAGTCSIAYYGEITGGGDAPDADTTDSIPAGDQLIWLLSSGNSDQGVAAAAEFQGYVIATCDFNWGHGYAFITDGFGGVPTLAQGYLALIIDARAANTVETLGQ